MDDALAMASTSTSINNTKDALGDSSPQGAQADDNDVEIVGLPPVIEERPKRSARATMVVMANEEANRSARAMMVMMSNKANRRNISTLPCKRTIRSTLPSHMPT